MRNNKWQQRITVFLAIFLSFGMVAGLVTPFLTNTPPPQVQPTDAPPPTQPAPPDTASITFDQTYLHDSGLFTAAVPTGYTLTNEFNSTGEAQVTFENTASISVLEIRVLRPTDQVSLDSAANLGDFFTEEWLRPTWNRYRSWSEDARRIEDDKLIMDFSLRLGEQDFVARQVAFTDGTWIYTLRSVYPSNATQAMQHVLDNEVESFQTIERFVGAPLEWDGYFDDASNHLIRFPGEWALVDSADGAPASVEGENAQLRLETANATIDSEQAASDYVASLRSNITVMTVEAVEQFGSTGYRVSYTLPTLDGDSQSGIVLILNGTETAHVANVLLSDVVDTDLNTVDLAAEDTAQSIKDVRATLDTLSLFPELDVTMDS